jgi:hypothetical protein
MGATLTAGAAAVITCTSNLAVNGAAGAVTFSISTSTDTGALTAQTGYTIVANAGSSYSSGSGLSPTPPTAPPTPAPTPLVVTKYFVTSTVSFSSMTKADFTDTVKLAFKTTMATKLGITVGHIVIESISAARRAVSVAFKVYSAGAVTATMRNNLNTFLQNTGTEGLAKQFQAAAASLGVTITPGAVTVTVAPQAGSTDSSSSSGGCGGGCIAGIVIGILVFLGLVGGGAYWWFYLRETPKPKPGGEWPPQTMGTVGVTEMQRITPRSSDGKKKKKKGEPREDTPMPGGSWMDSMNDPEWDAETGVLRARLRCEDGSWNDTVVNTNDFPEGTTFCNQDGEFEEEDGPDQV